MKGKLIVLEGTDGSGKATQAELLYERIKNIGLKVKKVDFPRYSEDSSIMIRKYLNGEFGNNPSDVNAYAASTFYAIDRFASYKQDWQSFYEKGGILVLDRYTTSNAVHQATKLPTTERNDFLNWLFDFEYNLMGIPEPDLVFYLDVPTEMTSKLMHEREEQTGTQADIHEKNKDYLKECRVSAKQIAKDCNWVIVNCFENGCLRTRESISDEIFNTALKVISERIYND